METFKKIVLNVMAHRYKKKAIHIGENLPLYQYVAYLMYDKPRLLKNIGVYLINLLGHNRLARDLKCFENVSFEEFYSLLNT